MGRRLVYLRFIQRTHHNLLKIIPVDKKQRSFHKLSDKILCPPTHHLITCTKPLSCITETTRCYLLCSEKLDELP